MEKPVDVVKVWLIAGVVSIVGALPTRSMAQLCPPGQVASGNSAGHCCWPRQAWSARRSTCVGIPQCPSGFAVSGEQCLADSCTDGRVVSAETAGHCCWGGQVWSVQGAECVGVPECPRGYHSVGEACVLDTVAPISLAQSANDRAPQPVVPVVFEAANNAHYVVTATAGASTQVCASPCVLRLTPGFVRLSISGDGRFEREVVIPPTSARVRLQHFSAGITVGWGIVSVLLGGVYFAVGAAGDPILGAPPFWYVCGSVMVTLGLVSFGVAAVRHSTADVSRVVSVARVQPNSLRFAGIAVAPARDGAYAVAAWRF